MGREDEERTFERVRAAGRGDVILLHRLQQRGLRLRRRAVDLVGQQDLSEDRTLDETQAAMACFLVQHFGAGDIGRHQIRRELNPFERQIQNLRQRLNQKRLRQPGDAGDETMAAGEQRHQHLVDDRVLPHDHLADLGEDALPSERHAFGDFR